MGPLCMFIDGERLFFLSSAPSNDCTAFCLIARTHFKSAETAAPGLPGGTKRRNTAHWTCVSSVLITRLIPDHL